MKKDFNKELVMTIEDNENFKNSTKCWICENDYVDNDVKVRDHCYITRKYRGSAHKDININIKLNHKTPVVFTITSKRHTNWIRKIYELYYQ